MRLKTLLLSMGNEGLSRLFHESVLRIIALEHTSCDVPTLANLILEMYGEHSLLIEVEKRRTLLEYLKKAEAEELCGRLDLNCGASPWDALKTARYSKERLSILFEYFELKYDQSKEDQENVAPDFIEVVTGDYGLFPHQEKAASKIREYLKGSCTRALLHMPTGAGKTRTAISIACDFIRSQENRNHLVVWLCDTEELCDQAAEEFSKGWKYLGSGQTKLYRMYGKREVDLKEVNSGFVICGLQKLNAIGEKYQADYYDFCKRVLLVVFDEAHKAVADTYQHAVRMFSKSKLLGLSATPGRSTSDFDSNEELARFFDYKKVSIEIDGYSSPIEYLQKNGYLAEIHYHDISYDARDLNFRAAEVLNMKNGEEPSDQVLRKLGLSEKRNLAIIAKAKELCDKNRKTIVFTSSVESAEAVFALLRYMGLKAGLVTAKTDSICRRDLVKRYKTGDVNILVNFNVLTTGFDAPITSAAIIARPTNSLSLFSQMVGRATRGPIAGGNDLADIYVIKDTLEGLRDMKKAFEYWNESWEKSCE